MAVDLESSQISENFNIVRNFGYITLKQRKFPSQLIRLENNLRSFACLTTGDMIAFTYNEKV